MVQRIMMSIRKFMYGRYGNDQLNVFLMFFYLVAYFLSIILNSGILNILTIVALAFALFRSLSRNPIARRRENAQFMKVAGPAISWMHNKRIQMSDHDHRYFKCPQCGQQLRVPRGKGKITVHCRSCGATFQENS